MVVAARQGGGGAYNFDHEWAAEHRLVHHLDRDLVLHLDKWRIVAQECAVVKAAQLLVDRVTLPHRRSLDGASPHIAYSRTVNTGVEETVGLAWPATSGTDEPGTT